MSFSTTLLRYLEPPDAARMANAAGGERRAFRLCSFSVKTEKHPSRKSNKSFIINSLVMKKESQIKQCSPGKVSAARVSGFELGLVAQAKCTWSFGRPFRCKISLTTVL